MKVHSNGVLLGKAGGYAPYGLTRVALTSFFVTIVQVWCSVFLKWKPHSVRYPELIRPKETGLCCSLSQGTDI